MVSESVAPHREFTSSTRVDVACRQTSQTTIAERSVTFGVEQVFKGLFTAYVRDGGSSIRGSETYETKLINTSLVLILQSKVK